MTKPFHYPELLARISSLLKRVQRIDESHLLRTGELVVNTLSKQVTVGGIGVQLSVKEFQLLATLAAEPERVFSKQELLERSGDSSHRAARERSTPTPAGSGRSWRPAPTGPGSSTCGATATASAHRNEAGRLLAAAGDPVHVDRGGGGGGRA